MKARSKPVSTVSFVPPMINTGPDIDKIHAMVERAIEKSQAKDEAPDATAASDKPKKKGFARSRGTTVGGSIGSYSEGYAANAANDLSSAC